MASCTVSYCFRTIKRSLMTTLFRVAAGFVVVLWLLGIGLLSPSKVHIERSVVIAAQPAGLLRWSTDKMIGADDERGLAPLKADLESQARPASS